MRAKKYRIVLGNMSRLPLSCPRMRKQSLLLLAALVAAPLFAQDDEKKAPAPVENLYFATDEYIAIPKYTFSYGYRALSGSKATFGGSSRVFNKLATAFDTSVVPTGSTTVARIYDDGTVGVDTRSDGAGRPMASDGTTNNWVYEHATQVSGGFVNFNTYTAKVLESPALESMGNTYGLEVTVSRDLPKLGRRILWNVSGGLSLNDIRQHLFRYEQANIETRTDKYYLDGQAAGTPGTSHPTSTTVTVVNPDGTTSTITTSVNDSTTLPNQPTISGGNNPVITQSGSAPSAENEVFKATVRNHYKIKGAYYTLRVGPTFIIPVTAKFRFSIGAGAALVYAGTTYTVDSEFTPTDDETVITRTDSGYDKKALPGYYLDANLEYWLTERTGLYAGAIFQSTGSYTQNITSEETLAEVNYSTNVDLTTQTGLRLGMNIRF